MNYLDQLPIKVITAHKFTGEDDELVLVDGDYDGEYISGFRWYVAKNGYVYRTVYHRESGTPNNGIEYLHRLVARPPEGMWVRHINGNLLDNRSANLEWMTPSESAQLRSQPNLKKKGAETTSKYRGVQRSVSQPKGGKRYLGNRWNTWARGTYIGSFATEEEAARAYDKVAVKMWGDRAILNFKETT